MGSEGGNIVLTGSGWECRRYAMVPVHGIVCLPQSSRTGNGQLRGCSFILSVATGGVEQSACLRPEASLARVRTPYAWAPALQGLCAHLGYHVPVTHDTAKT